MDRKTGQMTLFPYSAQIALGGRNRIKRGKANFEQLWRRKRVIDKNLAKLAPWKSRHAASGSSRRGGSGN